MKSLLFFLLGAVVGAAGGVIIAKKKLEDEAYDYYEAEIEEYKRHVRDDILEADNLERHDKRVASKAINDFIAENCLDIPFIADEDNPFDEMKEIEKQKAENISKKNKYADDIPEEEDEDEEPQSIPFITIHEVSEEEADNLECEKNYECIFYTWKKGSSQLIYSGHEFVDITDVLEDYATSFIEGIHDVGEVVNIANHELKQLYVITVDRP